MRERNVKKKEKKGKTERKGGSKKGGTERVRRQRRSIFLRRVEEVKNGRWKMSNDWKECEIGWLVNPGGLGLTVHCGPSIFEMSNNWKECEIGWLVNPGGLGLMVHCGPSGFEISND